jgi:hypothetical protein
MPPDASLLVRTIHPYALHVSLLVYTPALLFADGATESVEPQIALGLVTFGVLWAASRRVEQPRRWEVWLCVPIATLFEVLGSLIWRGYTYELRNIPLYVPPGHALVYVFGITAGTLPVVRRHGRSLRRLVMLAASGWVLAGLTVLPLLTGRLDVQGAVLWPLLAWCVLRSGKGEMFAAIWVAVATIEIAGTWAGDWVWAASAPWSHLPSGNPPSAIAAGYAVIDGSVALLAPLVLALAYRARATLPSGRRILATVTDRESSRRPWNRTTLDRRIRAALAQPARRRLLARQAGFSRSRIPRLDPRLRRGRSLKASASPPQLPHATATVLSFVHAALRL